MEQLYWEDVTIGDDISSEVFPLTVARLIMAAGANRDFNSIHHNSVHAQRTGAPDMYANVIFLQGMWEKTVRNYIGLSGTIKSLKGFRMRVFNTVGDTVVTKGVVKKKWKENEEYLVELEIWSENSKDITVGPGLVLVTLPTKEVTNHLWLRI